MPHSSRLRDPGLGCARVPDPLESELDPALLTDFIAQCHAAIRETEQAHTGGGAVFRRLGGSMRSSCGAARH